jgi:antitoxin component of MazEF toxin-antitoxin module
MSSRPATSRESRTKIPLRRIGNSLGVILPRATLAAWGVKEGDELELTDQGLKPPRRRGLSHQELDELKRVHALAVVRQFSAREIRAKILANLYRWKRQGVWVTAYDEWKAIAETEDEGALYASMLGRDEDAVRLRQSAPYVGLLPKEEVRRLNEEAAA